MTTLHSPLFLVGVSLSLMACSTPDMGSATPIQSPQEEPSEEMDSPDTGSSTEDTPAALDDAAEDQDGQAQEQEPLANVVQVEAQGAPGAYTFSVTIRSQETGCAQYADWWEVLTEDGQLIYRRILGHSHVSEQPFTRSGGPVALEGPDTTVWVRAHMNPGGYGGQAMRGNLTDGFTNTTLAADSFAALAQSDPLPSGCAF